MGLKDKKPVIWWEFGIEESVLLIVVKQSMQDGPQRFIPIHNSTNRSIYYLILLLTLIPLCEQGLSKMNNDCSACVHLWSTASRAPVFISKTDNTLVARQPSLVSCPRKLIHCLSSPGLDSCGPHTYLRLNMAQIPVSLNRVPI